MYLNGGINTIFTINILHISTEHDRTEPVLLNIEPDWYVDLNVGK